ncbi:Ankyrin repeat domain-containing protein [Paramyrothecium foliicola]|nr:Ankyrin repeat domain-containing protein [Paramyrothecium foliicola]
MSSTKRISEEEWWKYKPQIQEMYLVQDMSLPAIVVALADHNFHPSKSQVERKLKAWGFRKNIPKRLGQDFWRYVHHEIEKRQAEGKKTHLYLDGIIQDSGKVRRETARHRGFRYGYEASPSPPEGLTIRLKTPPPLILTNPWPPTLPWLRFKAQVRNSIMFMPGSTTNLDQSSVGTAGRLSSLVLEMAGLQLGQATVSSPSSLASLLESTIPESYPGEISDQCVAMLRGPSQKMIYEQLLVLMFGLSNKMVGVELSWEFILELLDKSGILSKAMIFDDRSTSLLALREYLFQRSFVALMNMSYGKIPRQVNVSSTVKLIQWLLASGQPADIAVHYRLIHFTPVQIAIILHMPMLLVLLLEHGANPNWTVHGHMAQGSGLPFKWRHRPMTLWSFPPLFLAVHCASDPDDIQILDILLSFGAEEVTIHHEIPGFLTHASLFTVAAWHEDQPMALALLEKLFGLFQIDSQTRHPYQMPRYDLADIVIAAASAGHSFVIQLLHDRGFDVAARNGFGLTALHAAAYMGHIDCCQGLINLGLSTRHDDASLPSPIQLACFGNHLKVVKFLHEHGSSINQHYEMRKERYKFLLMHYFCHMVFGFSEEEIGRMTAPKSHIEAAMVEASIPANTRRVDNPTYLDMLADFLQPPFDIRGLWRRRSSAPLISYLLQHGETLPISPDYMAFQAAHNADAELLRIALQNGANCNKRMRSRGGSKKSMLQHALHSPCASAIFGRIGIAKRLIDRNASLNEPAVGWHGRTALEGAAEHGHIDMVDFLLHHGVDTTNSGRRQYIRAIRFAEREGHYVTANLLRNHRARTIDDETMSGAGSLLNELEGERVRHCCEAYTMWEYFERVVPSKPSSQADLCDIQDSESDQSNEDSDLWLEPQGQRVRVTEGESAGQPSEGIYKFDEPLFGVEEASMYEALVLDG